MSKAIKITTAPYDAAHFNERMGAGPIYIIDHDLIQKLEHAGYVVNHKQIMLEEKFPTEITSTFKLLSKIKSEISESNRVRSFPIVLSGNCCATVGVIAGLNDDEVGIIWFDAHGDCETPETTTSGFLDGMSLSMLTSSCWRNILSSYKLSCSVPGKNIMLIGARDLSQHEREFIAANNINHIAVNAIKSDRHEIIKAGCTKLIQNGIKKLHFHIDADVIDPSIVPANSYSVKDGLGKEDLIEIINYCGSRIPISSLTIASYDPLFDKDDRMLTIINEVIQVIAKRVG